MNRLACSIILLLLFSIKCVAQKQKLYLLDKTDPFTKERRINYGNAYLNEFSQVGIELKIKDSSKTFGIIFMIPYLNYTTEGVDTTTKECKLKTSTGQIINGVWINTTSAEIVGKRYTGFSYQFSESDFKSIMGSSITAVKTNQYTYEIPVKNQNKIGELIKKVYSVL